MSYRKNAVVAAFVAGSLACATSQAQTPSVQVSADSLIAAFALETERGDSPARLPLQRILLHPEEFEPGARDQVADALQGFILDEYGSESFRFVSMSLSGLLGSEFNEDPASDFLDRVEAVVSSTEDPGVLNAAAVALRQSDRRFDAITYLVTKASEECPFAANAVGALASSGAPGRAALLKLAAGPPLVNEVARRQLELWRAAEKRRGN
jgi:hypothetical protein